MIDRERLAALLGRERDTFAERHPRSRAAYRAAGASLLGNVPMTWMNKAAGRFPVYLAEAEGPPLSTWTVTLCRPVPRRHRRHGRPLAGADGGGRAAALRRGRRGHGDAPDRGRGLGRAELARRFGVPLWSFSLTATDANRWAIRLARLVTDRPKILVFNYCYHGTVDEAFITLTPTGGLARGQRRAPRSTRPPPPGWSSSTTLTRSTASWPHGDVACVLMEPALTNIGIVLPAPGYLEGVRELTRRHGTLLINDETHTLLGRAGRLHPGLGP